MTEVSDVNSGDARDRQCVPGEFQGELVALFGNIGSLTDALTNGLRNSNARDAVVHEVQCARGLCEAYRRQDGRAGGNAVGNTASDERLKHLGLVANLKLQEASACVGLNARPFDSVVLRWPERRFNRAHKQIGCRLDGASTDVVSFAESRSDLHQRRTVEIEHATSLGLITSSDIVSGERANVNDAEKSSADDICLSGKPVLISADDLHDRLCAKGFQRDGDSHIRRMCVCSRVIRRVDAVHIGKDRIKLCLDGVEVATVDRWKLRSNDGSLPRLSKGA